jgi:hypothetical protein
MINSNGTPDHGELALLSHHLLVCGQRDQREVLAVEVVHQVKDAGEAGSGVPGLVPETLLPT